MNNILDKIITNIESINKIDIDDSSWTPFKVCDLFNVECSKYHNPDFYNHGLIPYVARTTFNNGVVRFVDTKEILYEGNCIIIGAESARAFYQKSPFITGNKVYRIYENSRSKMNKQIALFLCTILNKEGEKYSYANAWISDKVKETIIKLPSKLINNNLEPDWDYMENYITTIENNLFI